MALNTPPILIPWGNTNTTSADMVQPGAGLNNTGFLPWPVVPDREHMNWMFNYLANALRFQQSRGVTPWNASETEYIVGSWVVYNNLLYKLTLASPTGANPATDTAHWTLGVPLQPGTVLRRTVIATPGAFSLAKAAGCNRAIILGVGCGGPGGGALGTTNPDEAAGPGGASGSWGEFETTSIPAVNWTGTIGAIGTPGAIPVGNAYTAGTVSGSTTVSDGTNTFTFPAGGPGTGNVSGSPADGGVPGSAPSAVPGTGVTVILAAAGQAGSHGSFVFNGSSDPVGRGGSSPFGAGGQKNTRTPGPGAAASGYGGGGGGGGPTTTPGYQGGASTGAYIELIEFS